MYWLLEHYTIFPLVFLCSWVSFDSKNARLNSHGNWERKSEFWNLCPYVEAILIEEYQTKMSQSQRNRRSRGSYEKCCGSKKYSSWYRLSWVEKDFCDSSIFKSNVENRTSRNSALSRGVYEGVQETWIVRVFFFTFHVSITLMTLDLFIDRRFGITFRHTTLGSTPLEEGSARPRDLYLHNTQQSQETDIHASGGIRTSNTSKREAAYPRLLQRGDYRQFL